MKPSRSLLLDVARRALGALLVLCLHAPLIADESGRTPDAAAPLPDPGDVSPRRIH